MRFMIIIKATPDSEASQFPPDADKMFQAMASYHEELAQAGVLLDASGLQPSSKGWRIRYDGDKRKVIDGPFTESKELIAGYTLIQVRSREEALQWTRRYPNPVGESQPAEIEVRQLYEMEDFQDAAKPETIDRFRKMKIASQNEGSGMSDFPIEEKQVRLVLEAWAKATREDRRDEILHNHVADLVIFDVLPPMKYESAESYRRSWDAWQPQAQPGMQFDLENMAVRAGVDLAFAHCFIRCGGTLPDGQTFEDLVRATFCLEKIAGAWKISHQHVSKPFQQSHIQ